MIGPQISELIAEVRLAMEFKPIARMSPEPATPTPTRSEALRQAAMGIDG
jgi:dihydrolipoamide dehydrogenase